MLNCQLDQAIQYPNSYTFLLLLFISSSIHWNIYTPPFLYICVVSANICSDYKWRFIQNAARVRAKYQIYFWKMFLFVYTFAFRQIKNYVSSLYFCFCYELSYFHLFNNLWSSGMAEPVMSPIAILEASGIWFPVLRSSHDNGRFN